MFYRGMQLSGEMKEILRLTQPVVLCVHVRLFSKLNKGRHVRQGGKLTSFRALPQCGKERFELNFESRNIHGALVEGGAWVSLILQLKKVQRNREDGGGLTSGGYFAHGL